jgi:RNA polymerase sigma-70 factor (ECF subfamily)
MTRLMASIVAHLPSKPMDDGADGWREPIQRAAAGDRQAMAELIGQLQDPWYAFCLSLLRDADLAREATQETAVRFITTLPTYAGHSRLRTWSMGIALNVCREFRRRKVHQSYDASQAPASSHPSPNVALAKQEQHAHLHRVMQSLSDRQREAIALRFFEHMSIAQVAQTMGCAQGTVKATIHQALASLREKWSGRHD